MHYDRIKIKQIAENSNFFMNITNIETGEIKYLWVRDKKLNIQYSIPLSKENENMSHLNIA